MQPHLPAQPRRPVRRSILPRTSCLSKALYAPASPAALSPVSSSAPARPKQAQQTTASRTKHSFETLPTCQPPLPRFLRGRLSFLKSVCMQTRSQRGQTALEKSVHPMMMMMMMIRHHHWMHSLLQRSLATVPWATFEQEERWVLSLDRNVANR